MNAPDFSPSEALLGELAEALQRAKGMPPAQATDVAAPIVRYLQQQYGGELLYIPQPYTRRPVQEIIAARDAGVPLKQILRELGISRRTYYRILSQHAPARAVPPV